MIVRCELLDSAMGASEVSEFEAIKSVSSKLGISEESVVSGT